MNHLKWRLGFTIFSLTLIMLSADAIADSSAPLTSKFGNCDAYAKQVVSQYAALDNEKSCWNPADPPFSIDANSGHFTPASWANHDIHNGKTTKDIHQICNYKGLSDNFTESAGSVLSYKYDANKDVKINFTVDSNGRASGVTITNSESYSYPSDVPSDAQLRHLKDTRTVKFETNSDGKCYVSSDVEESGPSFSETQQTTHFSMRLCSYYRNLTSAHKPKEFYQYGALSQDYLSPESNELRIRAEKVNPEDRTSVQQKQAELGYTTLQNKCDREYKTFVDIKMGSQNGGSGEPGATSR